MIDIIMKRFTLLFLTIILLFPIVSAQVMREMNIIFDIESENRANVEIDFTFSEEIKRINTPFTGGISAIETENGKCEIVVNVQQILQCEPPSPFVVGDWTIKTKFKLDGVIEKQGNISTFSFDVPVLWQTERIIVTVRLPAGMALSENVVLPVSPSGSFSLFEGRRFVIRWNFENIESGNIIPIRVSYEFIGPVQQFFARIDPRAVVVIIVLLGVGVGLIGLTYLRISKRKGVVLSVLNENERNVVDIIQKQEAEKVDQRQIVTLSGFSKAKVSRIIQSLEQRGLVETERIGRKNRVKLKRRLLEE